MSAHVRDPGDAPQAMTDGGDDPLAFALFNEIGIIDQLTSAMLTTALPPGVTTAQFGVLNHFVRLGLDDQSPAALAAAFQVRRPTMTSLLARMAAAGLIIIRADPDDGRAKRVSLTPAGRAMRARCVAALAPLVPIIRSIISDAAVADLLPQLRRLRIALDALRDRDAN